VANTNDKLICGLVMPISAIDGMSEAHWAEVLKVISDAIENAGFVSNLVSNADDIGIIQKRIIQNLYDNPIVVCDVSGKNPNVMFELGMRLAFDKPTIIIKDDKTSYSFDTAPIEHISYPRDLRYSQIVEFKSKLTEKIKATHAKATSDPNYTTFLKNFGEFTVAKLDKKEVSGQEFILEELKTMRHLIQRLERRGDVSLSAETLSRRHNYSFDKMNEKALEAISDYLLQEDNVEDYEWSQDGQRLRVELFESAPKRFNHVLLKKLNELEKKYVGD
jgi:hypothetical protein